MKNAKLILRLGNSEPIPGDIIAMMEICDRNLHGTFGASLPIGVLSIVKTNKTGDEIKKIFQIAGKESDDILPVIIFDLYDPNVSFDFAIPDVKEMIKEFEKYYKIDNSECEYSLNELLDKIKQVGMEGLSKKELARLKSF